MKSFILLLALVFVATVAVVVGLRLGDQGRAFVAGVACGVLVSFPASVIAFFLNRRDEPGAESGPAYPLVILSQPAQAGRRLPDYPPAMLAARERPAPGGFTIIGDEGEQGDRPSLVL